VLADEAGGDCSLPTANHNRIVVASLEASCFETIGSGAIRQPNGAYDKATFDHPQGNGSVGDHLYVPIHKPLIAKSTSPKNFAPCRHRQQGTNAAGGERAGRHR